MDIKQISSRFIHVDFMCSFILHIHINYSFAPLLLLFKAAGWRRVEVEI